jgi:hypothetical protein
MNNWPPGPVELVEDRPGREQVLGGSEGLLHSPQKPFAERGFERLELGVGTQHEDGFELFSSSTLYASIAKC